MQARSAPPSADERHGWRASWRSIGACREHDDEQPGAGHQLPAGESADWHRNAHGGGKAHGTRRHGGRAHGLGRDRSARPLDPTQLSETHRRRHIVRGRLQPEGHWVRITSPRLWRSWLDTGKNCALFRFQRVGGPGRGKASASAPGLYRYRLGFTSLIAKSHWPDCRRRGCGRASRLRSLCSG